MVEWLAKYWLEALFSGILTGLSFIVKMMWNRQKQEDRRQKAIELGIQALLRDRVVQAYYHYTERGWITLHGLEAAEKMYTPIASVAALSERHARDDSTAQGHWCITALR